MEAPAPLHGIVLAMALAGLACAHPPVPSAPVAAPPAPGAAARPDGIADLERAFWACDYVATTRGIGATPIAACRHATESLKREKFGGSFPALLEWWRDNKEAEHGKLQRLY